MFPMDLPTAINHRWRLKSELDAINHQGLGLPLSSSAMLLAMEIDRLDYRIAIGYTREITIPVENVGLMLGLSNVFEVRDIPSGMKFKAQLTAELNEISKLRLEAVFPLTVQLNWRVIERLEDEMAQFQESEVSSSYVPPPPPSPAPPPRRRGGWKEYVNLCINDAVNFVIQNDPEGGRASHAIRRLESDPSIQVNDDIRRTVRRRFFEVQFPLYSKPAPSVLPTRRT